MLMILAEIYVLVCTLFLARKDATIYRLMSRDQLNITLRLGEIERWYRDSVALNTLIIMPIVYLAPYLSWIILYTVLIRLAIFDIAFNSWAKLDLKYLGSVTWTDKIFIKVFGKYGAIRKAVVLTMLLIILNFIL